MVLMNNVVKLRSQKTYLSLAGPLDHPAFIAKKLMSIHSQRIIALTSRLPVMPSLSSRSFSQCTIPTLELSVTTL